MRGSDGQLQQLRRRRWSGSASQTMPRDSSGAVDNAKLERWLWCVALYPSVKDAKKAARAGAVQVNGKTVKPAKKLRSDDAVTLGDGRTISVLGIPRADAVRPCRAAPAARWLCHLPRGLQARRRDMPPRLLPQLPRHVRREVARHQGLLPAVQRRRPQGVGGRRRGRAPLTPVSGV